MLQTTNRIFLKARKVAMIFRAINNKTRQQIIQYLQEHPETNVTALYVQLRLEQSVASQHLAILRQEGIVKTRREGKQILYSVDEKRLALLEVVADQLLSKK